MSQKRFIAVVSHYAHLHVGTKAFLLAPSVVQERGQIRKGSYLGYYEYLSEWD